MTAPRTRHVPVAAVVLGLGFALAVVAGAQARLPRAGVLVPGKSLAGVRLGDTMAVVERKWGNKYQVCDWCQGPETTWMWMYPTPRADRLAPNGVETYEPLGAGVRFRNGRVAAVFTLGSPDFWQTSQGLKTHGYITPAQSPHGAQTWVKCFGFDAMTTRAGNVVTSIYTTGGNYVYGFGLSFARETPCP